MQAPRPWFNGLALLLALCLPVTLLWVHSGFLFPFVASKVWLLRGLLLLGLLLALWSPRAIKGLRDAAITPLFAVLLIYSLWALFSNLQSDDSVRAFWSTYERLEGGLSLCFALIWLLFLAAILDTHQHRKAYFSVICVVLVALAVVAIMQDNARVSGVLGNPIYLGSAMAMGWFVLGFTFCLGISNVRSRAWVAVLWCAAALVSILFWAALYQSGSRGPLLGLVVGLIVYGYCYWHLLSRPCALKAILSISALCIFSLALSWAALSGLHKSDFTQRSLIYRLLEMGQGNQTTLDRLANWSVAVDVAQQRPLLGHGAEAYTQKFSEHYQAGVLDNADLWFDRAHNLYLDVLAAHGLIGLALFLLLFGVAAHCVWRHPSFSAGQKACMLGFLSCYMAKNSVGFDDPSSTLLLISMLSAVLWKPKPAAELNQLDAHIAPSPLRFVTQVAASIAVVAALYLTVLIPAKSNESLLGLVRTAAKPGSFSDPIGVARLEKIQSGLSEINAQFPAGQAEHLQALYESMIVKSTLSEAAINFYFEESKKVIAQQPNNHRIQFNAGILLAKFEQTDAAIKVMQRLVQQVPNRTLFWAKLYALYMQTGRLEEADAAAKTVQRLNSSKASKLGVL